MSNIPAQPWSIRWKGETHSFDHWQDVEEALERGDLSLVHEIEYGGRWWVIKDFLEKEPWLKPTREVPRPRSSSSRSAHVPPDHPAQSLESFENEEGEVEPKGIELPPEFPPPHIAAAGVGVVALLVLVFAGHYSLVLVLGALVGILSSLYLVITADRPLNFVGIGLLALTALTTFGMLFK